MAGNLAPDPRFPERVKNPYLSKMGENTERHGLLRFEEGLASDTDVPDQFIYGAMQGYETAPGRPNHNKNVYEKPAAETMRERAHVGSATWPEAPTYLGGFAAGAHNDGEVQYVMVKRDGGHQNRPNPIRVTD
jgi:hypothetical protein